jgi:hypothetical protein
MGRHARPFDTITVERRLADDELDMRMSELKSRLGGWLADHLFENGLAAVSEARWTVEAGPRRDSPAYLVVTVEVEPWADPTKRRRRRREVAA